MAGEVEKEIFEAINNKQSFVLDAGAGSGKTTTLVSTLKYILNEKGTLLKANNQQVACITYTNIAKDEIIERIEHNDLVTVSTIHDFLWRCISIFQKELKKELLNYISLKIEKYEEELSQARDKETKKYKSIFERKIKYESYCSSLRENAFNISYRQFKSFSKGIISHDEVIKISEKLFASSKLCKLISDLYPLILIDEYQDTHKEVMGIFLEYMLKTENIVLGFYGDKMQRIYDHGYDNQALMNMCTEYNLKKITKTDNYRCSKKIIELLNKIREDGIQQDPAGENLDGGISVYLSSSDLDVELFIESKLSDKFCIAGEENKILFLTHRYIAEKNGYPELFELYRTGIGTDCIIKNEDNRELCPFMDFIFDIEYIVMLYVSQKIQLLLNKIYYDINSFNDIKKLRNNLEELLEIRKSEKIIKVIKFVIESRLLKASEQYTNYPIEEKRDFYEKIIDIEYQQAIKLYEMRQRNSPFSTEHGTKGDEYDNVLVVIDDSSWNKYNFNDYFSGNKSNINRYVNTRNLFYVIASRAKNNFVALCLSELNASACVNLKKWFGQDDIMEIN